MAYVSIALIVAGFALSLFGLCEQQFHFFTYGVLGIIVGLIVPIVMYRRRV